MNCGAGKRTAFVSSLMATGNHAVFSAYNADYFNSGIVVRSFSPLPISDPFPNIGIGRSAFRATMKRLRGAAKDVAQLGIKFLTTRFASSFDWHTKIVSLTSMLVNQNIGPLGLTAMMAHMMNKRQKEKQ